MVHPSIRAALGVLLLCLASQSQSTLAAPPLPDTSQARQSWVFVENRGQWDPSEAYRLRRGPATCWFVADGWVLGFEKFAPPASPRPDAGEGVGLPALPRCIAAHALAMRFANGLGVRVMLAEFSPIPGTPDGEMCRGLVDLDEPLLHNKTAFAITALGEAAVNRYKQLCRDLNYSLTQS